MTSPLHHDVSDVASLQSTASVHTGSEFMAEGCDALIETYRQCCEEAGVKPISSFVKLLRLKQDLSSLVLDHSYFGERGFAPVLSTLRGAKVTYLSIKSCMMTHDHIGSLRKVLGGHPYLTHLNLCQNELGPQSAKHILDLLGSSPAVVKVDIEESTPKFQQIQQKCLSNNGVHVPLTVCVFCKRSVLGIAIENVEGVFLKELFRAARSSNDGNYCNKDDQPSQALMWTEIRSALHQNGYILSVCGAPCLHGWVTHLLSLCQAAGEAGAADPCEAPQHCARCGVAASDSPPFLPRPYTFVLESVTWEVAKLGAELMPSMLARLTDAMAALASADAPAPTSAGDATHPRSTNRATPRRFSLCSPSCGRAVIRAGLYGDGGLLPLPRDSRDWKLHDHFGLLKVPDDTGFSCVDDLITVDQGELPLSAAAGITLACQHGDESYDPLYTYASAKLLSKKTSQSGFGIDLRSACKSVVKHGVLLSVLTVFHAPSDPIEKWESFATWGAGLAALHKAAASRRKRAYFSVEPPPGTDLFDAIRSASFGLHAARRPLLAGVKWRSMWNDAPKGIIPSTRHKGGTLHAIRIFGQRIVEGVPHLITAPCFGNEVGEQGLFFFSREVVNREFRYGCFAFREIGDVSVGLRAESVMSSASPATRQIIKNRGDVEAVIEILSTPSARKCETLHRYFMPLLRAMPQEASFLFRSKNIIATQHEEELLSAVNRLYKGTCQAQVVFFWECQTSRAIREWVVELLLTYDEVKVSRQHSLKRSGTTFKLRRFSATSLGGAEIVKFDPALRPAGAGAGGLRQGLGRKKNSLLHMPKGLRDATLEQESSDNAKAEAAAQNWNAEQDSKKKDSSDRATKAEMLFTKALAATLGLKRLAYLVSRSSSSSSTEPALVTAQALRSGIPTAFLQFTRSADNLLMATACLFFCGELVSLLDTRRSTVPKFAPCTGHQALKGFPFHRGVDAVAYECPYESPLAYIFSSSVWAVYHIGMRRMLHGPYLTSTHPLFRGLPDMFHSGVSCVVSVPKSSEAYFIKDDTAILWDTKARKALGKLFKLTAKGSDFAGIPPEFGGRITGCVYLSVELCLLFSKGYSCTWSFSGSGNVRLIGPRDETSVILNLPPHLKGDVSPLMRRLSNQLMESFEFASATLYTGVPAMPRKDRKRVQSTAAGDAPMPPNMGNGMSISRSLDSTRAVLSGFGCDISFTHMNLLLPAEPRPLGDGGGGGGGLGPDAAPQQPSPADYPLDVVKSLLVADMSFVPCHPDARPVTGVLGLLPASGLPERVAKALREVPHPPSEPAAVHFRFATLQDFGYVQIAGEFAEGATVHIETSADSIAWQRLCTVEARRCVTEGCWGERLPSHHWRVLVEQGTAGDTIHRIHWYTVPDAAGTKGYRFLRKVLFTTPVHISACAPIILNPGALCPTPEMSGASALVSWAPRKASTLSGTAAAGRRGVPPPPPVGGTAAPPAGAAPGAVGAVGWYRKHCIVPLLNAEGMPSDVSLFFTGTFFAAWSYPAEGPQQLTSSSVHSAARFSDLPRSLKDVGFDAAVYRNPASSPSEIYLFSDSRFVLWDLELGSALGEVGEIAKSPDFHSLPPPFNTGFDTATNLFQRSSNEAAFFREGYIIYWNLDTHTVVRGPFKIGAGIHRGGDALCAIPQWAVLEQNLCLMKLPPSAGGGFGVFAGSKWFHLSAERDIYLGPYDVSTHRRYIKLSGVLGWNVLEKNAHIMLDLNGAPQLFVGCKVVCQIGETQRTNFRIQYSDDAQIWETCADIPAQDSGSASWVISAVQNQSHRFWKVMLWPFVHTSITKIEWLGLPSRPVHTIPAEVTTTAEVTGDIDQLFTQGGGSFSQRSGPRQNINRPLEAVYAVNDTITYDLGVAFVDTITVHCEVLDLYGNQSLKSVRTRSALYGPGGGASPKAPPTPSGGGGAASPLRSPTLRSGMKVGVGRNLSSHGQHEGPVSPKSRGMTPTQLKRHQGSLEGCKWDVHASRDGKEWKYLASIVCFSDGIGCASWDPFDVWKHWRLTLVKGHCLLTKIQSTYYSGPLAGIATSRSEQLSSVCQPALLVMDSEPKTCTVDLPSAGTILLYDLKDSPQAFVKVSVHGQFARSAQTPWSAECSHDGKKWVTLNEAGPVGSTIDLSWDVGGPCRYWRIRSVGDAQIASVNWLVPQASLGRVQSTPLTDAFEVSSTGEAMSKGRLEAVLSAEAMKPSAHPVVCLGAKQTVTFSSVGNRLHQLSGLSLRTAFKQDAPSQAQPSGKKSGMSTESMQVHVDPVVTIACWVYPPYGSALDENACGRWVTIASQTISSEVESLSWGYAGTSDAWRIQLTEGARLSLVGCEWRTGGFTLFSPVEPECVECSDESQQAPAEWATLPSVRGKLLHCHAVAGVPLKAPAVRLRKGQSITFGFPSLISLKLFSVVGTGRLSLQVLRDPAPGGGDGAGEDGWETIAQGADLLTAPCSERHSLWRLAAEREACVVETVTAMAVALGRSVSALEPATHSMFGGPAAAPRMQAVAAVNKRAIQVSHIDSLRQCSATAKDMTKKIGKYLKDRKAQIRVSGVDLGNLATNAVMPGKVDEMMALFAPDTLHVKDFKLIKPFDADDTSNGYPRLDYRGEVGGDCKGLTGAAILSFIWDKPKLPAAAASGAAADPTQAAGGGPDPKLPSIAVCLTFPIQEEWKPIASFTSNPALLYMMPPEKSKSLMVVTSSGVTVTGDTKVFIPAESEKSQPGISFGTEQCSFHLLPGVSVIGEVTAPDEPTLPVLQLLTLLMPDVPVAGIYHTASFSDKTMTLWLDMGTLSLDSLGGSTDNVHVEVVSAEEGYTLRVGAVVQWQSLSFSVTGEVVEEDEGTLRLMGPLISGEWNDMHRIPGARFLDLVIDLRFASPMDSPNLLSVASASIGGTIVFQGTTLASRFQIEISDDCCLNTFTPFVSLDDVSRFCLLPLEKQPAPALSWVRQNVTLEDVSMSLSGGPRDRRHAVTGRLKILGASGDCQVQANRRNSAGEYGISITASLQSIRLGSLLVDSLESSCGVSVELSLSGSAASIKFTGSMGLVGLQQVPTSVVLSDTETTFTAEACIGGYATLHASLCGRGVGPAPAFDDFLVSGQLDRAKIQASLHDLTLQLPLIQGVVGAGLLFTLRLDGLELQPFPLSRPTLCVRFVGVIMGSDFDLIAALNPEYAGEFLPHVASEIIEQGWSCLLSLYQEFTTQVDAQQECVSDNPPVITFHETTGNLCLTDDDW